jgi:4-hydroxybenzoate polyprenyltransferase
VGLIKGTGLAYGAGLAVASGFAVYQQWLIRKRDRAACFDAFMNNNLFGAAVFIGLALDYFLRAR